MEAIQQATFTPLTRGRYRCNQTGEPTKNTKKYAFMYYRQKRNEQLRKAQIDVSTIRTTTSSAKVSSQSSRGGSSAKASWTNGRYIPL